MKTSVFLFFLSFQNSRFLFLEWTELSWRYNNHFKKIENRYVDIEYECWKAHPPIRTSSRLPSFSARSHIEDLKLLPHKNAKGVATQSLRILWARLSSTGNSTKKPVCSLTRTGNYSFVRINCRLHPGYIQTCVWCTLLASVRITNTSINYFRQPTTKDGRWTIL